MGEARLPRLGFLGVGWIGRQRMERVHAAGAAEVAAVADADGDAAGAAAAAVGCDQIGASIQDLLACELDGIVLATPTALHAEHARAALGHGLPVFCQKPLGRTAGECRELVDLARSAGVRLGVDMSYRYVRAVTAALEALRAGAIGEPHAAELVFHNAYGPDKAWARDARMAGGGALIDLGCHMLDLGRLFLGTVSASAVQADLFAGGVRLPPDPQEVEDLALAQVTLEDGRALRLACSWWLAAGRDAVIEATFFGPGRALSVRNIDGSFYDFEALLVEGRTERRIEAPGDDWGGAALVAWARALAQDRGFDEGVSELVPVAELIDRIYGRPA